MKKRTIYVALSFFLFLGCFCNVNAAETKECENYHNNTTCCKTEYDGINHSYMGIKCNNTSSLCTSLKNKCEASNYVTENYPACREKCNKAGYTDSCSLNLCHLNCKQNGLDAIKKAGMNQDDPRWKELKLSDFEKKLKEAGVAICTDKSKYNELKNGKTTTKESENFWDNLFKGSQATNKCGNILSDRALKLLVQIYKTITQIAVVVVIILGMLDFFKATSVDDADAMKKVWQKFIKRLVTVILLVMLPFILEFILSVFGDETMRTCLNEFH